MVCVIYKFIFYAFILGKINSLCCSLNELVDARHCLFESQTQLEFGYEANLCKCKFILRQRGRKPNQNACDFFECRANAIKTWTPRQQKKWTRSGY